MSDVARKLETIFADLMYEETVPVRQRAKVNCASWDSLLQLQLILAIEQEFEVIISDREASALNSFAAALHVLEEKLSSKR